VTDPLDADIAKCFDRIDQTALLAKLDTTPTFRRAIRAWLEAGVMDGEGHDLVAIQVPDL
jgi:RNA-directed DNA polymerase